VRCKHTAGHGAWRDLCDTHVLSPSLCILQKYDPDRPQLQRHKPHRLQYIRKICAACTALFVAGAASKTTIRCMSLEDSSVLAASQAVQDVLRQNQTAALRLASLFDQYLYLLTDDTDALLLKFAQQAESPAMEAYQEHLSSCRAAAETIRW